MTHFDWDIVKTIACDALELPAEHRETFLRSRCKQDEALFVAVSELVLGDIDTTSSLQPPVQNAARRMLDHRPLHFLNPGDEVGPYTIDAFAASGGVGHVYRCHRTDALGGQPIALKIIPTAMASPDNLRRFDDEHVFLSLLRHRNIAGFLAGGIEGSIPYLAMEFIDGEPIDQYCDRCTLPIAKRIELFQQVCSAVNYAHQHLILHRDIKPRNILVDTTGIPKLVDFGVAKIMSDGSGNRLSDPTVTMRPMVTPQYASPEQMCGHPLSTATDVYSLGVVLYELLSGHRPYHLESMNIVDAQQVITESTPQRPSRVIDAPGAAAANRASCLSPRRIAQDRRTEPWRLRRELSGDLDNVVMKAIHKDPQSRYQTVEQLAEDLRRHVVGLPVAARRDTLWYRARKMIVRNRVIVLATAVAVTSLLFAVATFAIALNRTHAALEQSKRDAHLALLESRKAARINMFLQDMLAATDPYKGDIDISVRQVLDRAAVLVEVELSAESEVQSAIEDTIGSAYTSLGMYDKADAFLQSAVSKRPDGLPRAESLRSMARLKHYRGEADEACMLLEEALSIQRQHLEDDTETVAETLSWLAGVRMTQGDFHEATLLFEEALDILERTTGKITIAYATTNNSLGMVLARQGKADEAEQAYREVLSTCMELGGEIHPETARTLNNLALLLKERGEYVKAEAQYLSSLKIYEQLYGSDHPKLIHILNNLASLAKSIGDYDRAEDYSEDAVQLATTRFPKPHRIVADCLHTQCTILRVQRKLDPALIACRDALAIRREVLGPKHPRIALSLNSIALILNSQGEYHEASTALSEAEAIYRHALGDQHPHVSSVLNTQALVAENKGDIDAAMSYLQDALDIAETSLGEHNPRTLTSVQNLARLHRKSGCYDVAAELFERALKGRRSYLPTHHPYIADTLAELGFILIKENRSGEAEPLLRECCEIRTNAFSKDHWKTANCLGLLGECLFALRDFESAEPLLQQSYHALVDSQGVEDELAQSALKRLVTLYEAWDKPERAKQHKDQLFELDAPP
jgi:serine/threonine-protein kinase